MARPTELPLSIPVVVPGRRGEVRLRTTNEVIDWIDASSARRDETWLRDVRWAMRQASVLRRRGQADDASDRLVQALANLKILQR
ncbi:hypothetical protein [Reyranella sp. CPCC 100927]|uniref:hypothetical protein n=1 Tax=Reyranella sp. CPCC 100927 TaxID=2599616 RepID=UPI0011B4FFFD|nr:hypothetical protein [Reyranella sp. CPCC 100927]TWT10664.1 hypothetical protein FQU96_16235 [Reyranella sp. CPCC 100927]